MSYKFAYVDGETLKDLGSDVAANAHVLNSYQQWVFSMWNHGQWTPKTLKAFPTARDELIMTCGLPGEVGEVLELVKKLNRDGADPTKFRKNLVLELGDALYYLNMIAARHGILMDEVVQSNIKKLVRRRARKLKKVKP